MIHSKYPSIGQYRNVIKEIKDSSSYVGKDEDGNPIFDRTKKAPTLTFTGTTKLHGCVYKDTLITLADGSRERIQDITPGTSILSYNEATNSIEFDIVNEVVIQNLDKPWVQLTFDDGSVLKCTSDHPILTRDGWIEAKDLTDNHEIIGEM